MKAYMKATESLRKDETFLFLSLKKPIVSISSQTIGKWIKKVLFMSGIDIKVFSGHSTRHAATSNAFASGLDLETIRKTAGWSNRSESFVLHYDVFLE